MKISTRELEAHTLAGQKDTQLMHCKTISISYYRKLKVVKPKRAFHSYETHQGTTEMK